MKNRKYLRIVRFSLIFALISCLCLTSGFAKTKNITVNISIEGVPSVISESVKDIPADAVIIPESETIFEEYESDDEETIETSNSEETEVDIENTDDTSSSETEYNELNTEDTDTEESQEFESEQENSDVSEEETLSEEETEAITEETSEENTTEVETEQETVVLPPVPPVVEKPCEENLPPKEYDYSKPVPLSDPVDDDYFESSLFIGDSRTVGLYNYSGVIGNCYAKVGLSIKNVLSTAFVEVPSEEGTETVTVIDAIKQNSDSFSKVYICFGLNELGWVSSQVFINTYDYVIDQIRELLPDIPIYVQAIIPVTQEVSDENYNGINNDRIAEYNQLIAEMAFENQVYYLETTEVFGSDCGYVLDPDKSFDGIHLNKDASLTLLEYLRIHTVEGNE